MQCIKSLRTVVIVVFIKSKVHSFIQGSEAGSIAVTQDCVEVSGAVCQVVGVVGVVGYRQNALPSLGIAYMKIIAMGHYKIIISYSHLFQKYCDEFSLLANLQ